METIDNPATRQVIGFVRSDPEADELEGWLKPGAFAGPLHVHPMQDEAFEVLGGRAQFEVAGKRIEAAAGQSISVVRGTPHTFRNGGEEELHIRFWFRPGLPSTRAFYRWFFQLGQQGRLHSDGSPPILAVAAALPHFSDHVRLASPPWPIQRAVLTALRPIAAVTGERVHL